MCSARRQRAATAVPVADDGLDTVYIVSGGRRHKDILTDLHLVEMCHGESIDSRALSLIHI